jgi:GNAT superfamily N-acetyltransferase
MKQLFLHLHKPGSDLTQDELNTINLWRVKEFQSEIIWGSDTLNAYATSEIFMIKDYQTHDILAFARLKPISLWINSEEYPIFGLGGVVTILRGQGLGRQLMHDIQEFADKVIVGFCNPKVTGFYQKTGMVLLPNGDNQFVYINEQDQRMESRPGDVFFYPQTNPILTKLKSNPATEALHYVPRW